MKALAAFVFLACSSSHALAQAPSDKLPSPRTFSVGVGGAFIPIDSSWVVTAQAALDRWFGDGPWGARVTASYFHGENVNIRSDGAFGFAQVMREWNPRLRSGLGALVGFAAGSAKDERFRAIDGLLYGAAAMPIAWRFGPELRLELALQAFWAKVHGDDNSLPGAFVSLSYFVF